MIYNWKHKFEADLGDKTVDKLVDKLSEKETIILKKFIENPYMSQPEIALELSMRCRLY